MAGIFGKLFSEEQRELSALEKIADQVLKYEPEMQALSDDELRAKTDEYRKRMADGETVDDLLPEAFATAREAATQIKKENFTFSYTIFLSNGSQLIPFSRISLAHSLAPNKEWSL